MKLSPEPCHNGRFVPPSSRLTAPSGCSRKDRSPWSVPTQTRSSQGTPYQNAPAKAPVSATCHSPKVPSPNPFGSSHLPQPHPPGVWPPQRSSAAPGIPSEPGPTQTMKTGPKIWRRGSESNRRIKVLQTLQSHLCRFAPDALPLHFQWVKALYFQPVQLHLNRHPLQYPLQSQAGIIHADRSKSVAHGIARSPHEQAYSECLHESSFASGTFQAVSLTPEIAGILRR